MTATLKTEEEKRAYAKEAAREMIANLRRRNAEYEAESGEPASISEAEYAKAEEEFERALLKVAGLKPLKAKATAHA